MILFRSSSEFPCGSSLGFSLRVVSLRRTGLAKDQMSCSGSGRSEGLTWDPEVIGLKNVSGVILVGG